MTTTTTITGHIATVVIGAGQAGLALSHCLTARGLEHVVLDRGTIAHSWRTQRWDSFTLLSPNWQTRLPGYRYRGADPAGFMTGAQVVAFFEDYARSFAAPVRGGVTVRRVTPLGRRWLIDTSTGTLTADNVVVATGDLTHPHVPRLGSGLSPRIAQLHTSAYRNPAQLPAGADRRAVVRAAEPLVAGPEAELRDLGLGLDRVQRREHRRGVDAVADGAGGGDGGLGHRFLLFGVLSGAENSAPIRRATHRRTPPISAWASPMPGRPRSASSCRRPRRRSRAPAGRR